MTNFDKENLIKHALKARKNSYSPYSKFAVGAAVVCQDGTVFTGCNIENISYPVGICGERVAISTAIAAGHKDFVAIAIVGAKDDQTTFDKCLPCGMCRQFMAEFGLDELIIITAKIKNDNITKIQEYKLSELIPKTFKI